MIIDLSKFGKILTSRQSGKEAYAAFSPTLRELSDNEEVIIDFGGVDIFSPSWGDEFLAPLLNEYKDRVKLKKARNLSVVETIKMLEQIHDYKFESVG